MIVYLCAVSSSILGFILHRPLMEVDILCKASLLPRLLDHSDLSLLEGKFMCFFGLYVMYSEVRIVDYKWVFIICIDCCCFQFLLQIHSHLQVLISSHA